MVTPLHGDTQWFLTGGEDMGGTSPPKGKGWVRSYFTR